MRRGWAGGVPPSLLHLGISRIFHPGTCDTSLVPPSLPRTMTKGDKTHGGFRGESKLKYWSRGLKKKSAEEKLASPFNVFMRTELERLKKVSMPAGACALL